MSFPEYSYSCRDISLSPGLESTHVPDCLLLCPFSRHGHTDTLVFVIPSCPNEKKMPNQVLEAVYLQQLITILRALLILAKKETVFTIGYRVIAARFSKYWCTLFMSPITPITVTWASTFSMLPLETETNLPALPWHKYTALTQLTDRATHCWLVLQTIHRFHNRFSQSWRRPILRHI